MTQHQNIISALDGIAGELKALLEAGRLQRSAWDDLGAMVRACEARYVSSMTPSERTRYEALRRSDVPVLDALTQIDDERVVQGLSESE